MTTQTLNAKSTWLRTGLFLSGIAALMVFSQISADTGQQAEATSVKSQPPAMFPIWIQDPYTSDSVLTYYPEPDQSLWNATRITDYEESLKVETSPPLGILTIRSLNIQVPIYNGTDEFILDRGAGRIKGMGRMDGDGNLGISLVYPGRGLWARGGCRDMRTAGSLALYYR
jgi:hypothetical protein